MLQSRTYTPVGATFLGAPVGDGYLTRTRRQVSSSTPQAEDAKTPDNWYDWVMTLFPEYVTRPFADHHMEMWDWGQKIEAHKKPNAFVGIWGRGGAKSSTAEMLTIYLGAKKKRNYCWYISETQDLADKHVDSIAGMIEESNMSRYHPSMARKAVGKYGQAKGWRRNRLHCGTDFLIDALGLDSGARGSKYKHNRPDFMVFDDIDDILDTPVGTKKKSKLIKSSLLPAGSATCGVLMIQNLIILNGVLD
mgnify:FL=1